MGAFGQVMKNMMNWQPSGSPAWDRQQQAKIQQAQEDRAAQQADLDFHQHMMELGALPVINGMVKEQQPLTAPASLPPDQVQQGSSPTPSDSSDSQATATGGSAGSGSGPAQQVMQSMSQPGPSGGDSSSMFDANGNPNPAASFGGPAPTSQALMQAMMPGPQTGNLTIVRKADPANLVKWKDHTGDQLAYELPTPESQRWNQTMRLRAQSLQQQTQAQEQGRLDAQNQQREQYGTPLSGDLAAQYGVDPDQKFLPAEKVQLATRYFPVVGAGVRGDATKTAAGTRADATKYKADLDSTTKQAVADQASMDRQNALDHHDKWNQALVAAKSNGQNNLNARAFVNGASRDMALHTTLLGDISKESQHQMLASSVLAAGPDGQPVTKDGDTFPDPWSGKQLTMNSAQRVRLGSALTQSQSTVSGYQQAAAELESRRDAILNRFGAPGSSSSPGGSRPLLWRGSGPAPPGSVLAPAGGPSDAPAVSTPGGASPNAGSSAPAAGPGSANWAPRGWGVQQVQDRVNAASAAATRPAAAPSASGTPAPGTPSGRPANWADAARSGAGPSAALPGRAAPASAATPGARTPAPVQHKAGETRTYNGRPYKFDGRQWIGQ